MLKQVEQIADYERRRSRMRSARVRAPIVRLCARRIAGPDNLMAAWQCPELVVLDPPERQLPVDLMQTRIPPSPAGEHCAAGT